MQVKIAKGDIGLDLIELERAAELVLEEKEQSGYHFSNHCLEGFLTAVIFSLLSIYPFKIELTGLPQHRENREFESPFFQTGKTQGIC